MILATGALFSAPVLLHIDDIEIGGKPVHLFPDEELERLFVVDYLNETVKVVDTTLNQVVDELDQSAYPVFCSVSANYVIVSDFWGHKLDFYDRRSLDYSHAMPVRAGPGYSIVRGDLLYFVSQREFYLQVADIRRKKVYQEFELTGRVPKFFILDDLAILPYYDNYHTWSRDFELEDSIGIINLSSIFRWSIEGKIKKPLNVIRLAEGRYAVAGYLDTGIHEINWGSKDVKTLVDWEGHSHIMDMIQTGGDLVVTSMSDPRLFVYNMGRGSLRKVPSLKGILDLEMMPGPYLGALSNFDETLQVFSDDYALIEEHPVGAYPIKAMSVGERLYVLCMDSAEINVFSIQGGAREE